jgi:hypothetical protein
MASARRWMSTLIVAVGSGCYAPAAFVQYQIPLRCRRKGRSVSVGAGDSGACSVECAPDGGVDSGADTSTE